MGLAGFNRARQRNKVEGASAPSSWKPYVKQDITVKQYCAICDKHYNNFKAYERHMQYKHTDLWLENNKFENLPIDLQKKLTKVD